MLWAQKSGLQSGNIQAVEELNGVDLALAVLKLEAKGANACGRQPTGNASDHRAGNRL